jgi:Fur family transcriptional regulator, peroxide stress response regulator
LREIKEKGLKLTPQRLEIINILSQEKSHPSAMDILAKARKKVPIISASTVYYTLDLLKREGLIKELEFYDRENRYEGDITDHLNLICKRCGKIEDFSKAVPFSLEMIEAQAGFRPVGMRFEYYGCCKNCRSKLR